jgi:hypothetical protein
MVFSRYLCLLACLPGVFSASLVDFSAARGDNPSMLGVRNMQAAREDGSTSVNTDELYIKLGQDPKGVPALHYHRDKGYIRAEYHLKDKFTADKTYYFGYQFSLADIEQSLMVWQLYDFSFPFSSFSSFSSLSSFSSVSPKTPFLPMCQKEYSMVHSAN